LAYSQNPEGHIPHHNPADSIQKTVVKRVSQKGLHPSQDSVPMEYSDVQNSHVRPKQMHRVREMSDIQDAPSRPYPVSPPEQSHWQEQKPVRDRNVNHPPVRSGH
jgi:hypothetical protein